VSTAAASTDVLKESAAPPVPPAVNPWIIAIAVMGATFLEVLDTTVVNVSLPHIGGSLSATVTEATWVLTSYLVANAIVLPITGWLGNYFGRKRLLLASVVGFTVASFFCGFAVSLPMLIVFRIIQGAAGGSLQPLSQAVLLEAFPVDQRGKAMGFWGLGIVVAPILGPVLGGWLTDNYSWRWVFYINIPVGAAAIMMIKTYVFDPPYIRRGTGRIDYWGIGFLAVGIGALQVVLDKGQQDDWFSSRFILTLMTLSIAGIAVFIMRELMVEHPVVDLHVFRDRTFTTGTFLMTMLGFVLYGSLVLLPIWLQTLLGYPATEAGIAMAPRGMGAFIAMPLVGAFLSKFDARKFLASGLLLAAGTLWGFSRLNLEAGYWDFFWPQFIQGLSMAMLFVPLTTITMGMIPREQMGNATSIFNLLRNVGGSIGIATVATMVERFQQAEINRLGAHVTPFNPQAMQRMDALRQFMWSQGDAPYTAAQHSNAAMFAMVQRQAAIVSYVETFRILAIVFLAIVPLILIMRKPKASKGPVAAH
jgi:MFS transporter, DHA2 family, multidrug resistance protein